MWTQLRTGSSRESRSQVDTSTVQDLYYKKDGCLIVARPMLLLEWCLTRTVHGSDASTLFAGREEGQRGKLPISLPLSLSLALCCLDQRGQ